MVCNFIIYDSTYVPGDRGPRDYKREISRVYIQYTSCACLYCLHPFVYSKRTREHAFNNQSGATFLFNFLASPRARLCRLPNVATSLLLPHTTLTTSSPTTTRTAVNSCTRPQTTNPGPNTAWGPKRRNRRLGPT